MSIISKDLKEKGIVNSLFHLGGNKLNPKMKKYIFSKTKGNLYILDIKEITKSLDSLEEYLKDFVEENKTILFLISTKNQEAEDIFKLKAVESKAPFITKWKGGLLTNFSTIKERVKSFKLFNDLVKLVNLPVEERNEKDEKKIKFLNLNKKKTSLMNKKWNKLNSLYGGLIEQSGKNNRDFIKKPDLIFMIGKDNTALKEINDAQIPAVVVCNSSYNPDLVDYVIPGNDSNIKSIEFITSFLAETIINLKEKEFTKKLEIKKEAEIQEVQDTEIQNIEDIDKQ